MGYKITPSQRSPRLEVEKRIITRPSPQYYPSKHRRNWEKVIVGSCNNNVYAFTKWVCLECFKRILSNYGFRMSSIEMSLAVKSLEGSKVPSLPTPSSPVSEENLSARPMCPGGHIFLGNFVLPDRIYCLF